jgi:hypothetical protein
MSVKPRLRDDSASFEGRLLRSSTRLDPPDTAEEELWQRLKLTSAVGAAGALGSAASHASDAAASRAAGGVFAAQLLKWGGIAVVAVSAVTATTLWLLPHHSAGAPRAALARATSSLAAESAANVAQSAPSALGETTAAPSDTPSAEASSHAALPGPADRASQLRVESAKLRAARSKLGAGDFQGALADVARLSAQFPHGVLIQEREVVAIDALTGLGESAAARSRAQAFLARYPDSPYAARLRPLVSGN